MRHECGIEFCQTFSVERIDPSAWPRGRRVLLIGLAVNNRDEMMTAEFLRRIAAAGHTTIGVLDEHRAEDWVTAFSRASLRSSRLLIKPVTGRKAGIRSAGSLLLSLMGEDADDHTRELCEAADAADRMNYGTHFGRIVNSAVKPDRHDDSRRVYLARHLATNREPDAVIQGWMKEYAEIVHNHREVLAARQDLGDGLVRIVTCGRVVDMTSLLHALYDLGHLVVMIDGEFFGQTDGRPVRRIAFGCAPGLRLNLAHQLRAAGIAASGYRGKPSIAPPDERSATEIVREILRSTAHTAPRL